jgi:hypothetical protein
VCNAALRQTLRHPENIPHNERRYAPQMIQIPDTPLLPEACTDLLASLLSTCHSFVEYGSGGSTLLAFAHQVPYIFSVESDRTWLQAVEARRDAMAPPYKGIHVAQWVDIGATGDWGYPLSSERHADYWKYPMAPWTREVSQAGADLVLIDGRFRVACLLLTCAHAGPGTTILFDDYVDRHHYHSVERLVRPVRHVDRMAVFKPGNRIPMGEDFLNLLLLSLQDTR